MQSGSLRHIEGMEAFMRKDNVYIPKLFLDTTVFNFYFEGRQGQKQKDTIRLFEAIVQGRYEAYTSQAVMNEIKDASKEKAEKMDALSQKHIKRFTISSPEVERMADIYIKKGIIPLKSRIDAIHIATAAVNKLDFVISYNLGHIVKTKTMIGTGLANLREGRQQIGLSTPTEVLNYDR
jgi:predicted nucleic acid-binding protein